MKPVPPEEHGKASRIPRVADLSFWAPFTAQVAPESFLPPPSCHAWYWSSNKQMSDIRCAGIIALKPGLTAWIVSPLRTLII